MAKQFVYIETTIFSYLAARPSRDLVTAARQQMTWDWWREHSEAFELRASLLVFDEARDGDPEAAARRLKFLDGIAILDVNDDVLALAEALVEEGVLPGRAAKDAAHVALAAVHGMDFLLTWNCKHLANAHVSRNVEHTVFEHGYAPPAICTPNELMGE